MLPVRKVSVILNEELSKNLGILKIERQSHLDTTVDQALYSLNYHYDLGISFAEDSNYMIDYIQAGQVVKAIDENIMILALPSVLSVEQAEEVVKMKDDAITHRLYVYLFVDSTLRLLQTHDESLEARKSLFFQALKAPEIVDGKTSSKIKK